jgi:hypothetical protein
VVVLLAGGVVVGPEVLGWAERAEIDLLANVGLGFLFLLAGYELDPGLLRQRPGRLAIIAWLITALLALVIAVPLALLTTALVGSSPSNAAAQQPAGHTNDDAMHADVNLAAGRVVIGPEFLTRRTELPNKLIVPARQVVELPSDATYDYIEVAGTLRASRAHDTTTRFTHLVVLPGGYLDVGTQADPIPCDRKVDFVVRDVPIDTARDHCSGKSLRDLLHRSASRFVKPVYRSVGIVNRNAQAREHLRRLGLAHADGAGEADEKRPVSHRPKPSPVRCAVPV